MSDLRFEPVDNALDYLASAARHLGEELDARDLKYGVLHLDAGIEVLAEAVLLHYTQDRREVIQGRLEITEEQFRLGAFKSIGSESALKHLVELGASPLNTDDLAAVKELGNYVDSSAYASPITRCVPYGDPSPDRTHTQRQVRTWHGPMLPAAVSCCVVVWMGR